ncbi:hypothetical protein D3C73_1611420 [compost metagenome]
MNVTGEQILHLRHVQVSAQRVFLALANVRLQDRRRHRVADAQVVLQIAFIALANVELTA